MVPNSGGIVTEQVNYLGTLKTHSEQLDRVVNVLAMKNNRVADCINGFVWKNKYLKLEFTGAQNDPK